ERMSEVYPQVNGRQPWGYLWAVTLPCQECDNRFPLTGSLVLRQPIPAKGDPGQSYQIEVDRIARKWHVRVHDGPPAGLPTLRVTAGSKGRSKSAICPFCEHVHATALHRRLSAKGLGQDELLLAADLDTAVGKKFREVVPLEVEAARRALELLNIEAPFGPGLPAVPDEAIPAGNTSVIQPSGYGAKSYGQLCNARQTLGFVRLARVIAELGEDLIRKHHLSEKYASALTAYAGSVMVRKIRRSTRGAVLEAIKESRPNRLHTNPVKVHDIFANEASVTFSYDYFESGLGTGPGTWSS